MNHNQSIEQQQQQNINVVSENGVNNNDDEITLLPYITHNSLKNEYAVYIPYKISDINLIEHCTGVYNISSFLGLSTDRSSYSPSYTYQYNDTTFEIGIIGYDLNKIYKTIESIQTILIEKKCEVDTNLKKIKITS
jgi:hypothetical protein